ncbi:hypothetical protein GCM10022243_08590 [Saccharothrix violaceirubra]|uniref:DUF4352 domain-containing protein n=1 Tax=Saccharothrix violaceirubra TaxID=413306 RepID=A0A7W7T0Z4_9PSEU|nr:hypothetical protein [Saccharothrix violaceirubra]MBB4963270.1 hypothetical protein [Saccharothrix violaceirubra]
MSDVRSPEAPRRPASEDPVGTVWFGVLAWPSIALGVVGLACSPVLGINRITAIVAGVGVVLGVIALFGGRKLLATVGVVLSVLAIASTVVVRTGSTDVATVGGGATASPSAAPDGLTWNQRFKWKDGLVAEIATPTVCTTGTFAVPRKINRAVKVTITVTNGTDRPFDAAVLTRVGGDGKFDNRKADLIQDSPDGGCGGGVETQSVAPGSSFTYDVAYSVSPQTGKLEITLQPGFNADKAVFSGQV